MILDEKKTTVAYRCPGCGAMVRSMIGAFTLSADMMRLKCPCGESDITIVYTPDKKLRLNVPCFFCPKPHNFLVSRNMFFGRELFTLPCAYSGLDICYIGEEGGGGRREGACRASRREHVRSAFFTPRRRFHDRSADSRDREIRYSGSFRRGRDLLQLRGR